MPRIVRTTDIAVFRLEQLQAAIDAANARGGGRVVLMPRSTDYEITEVFEHPYSSSRRYAFMLKSNVHLVIQAGATLTYADEVYDDLSCTMFTMLNDTTNVRIDGGGAANGNTAGNSGTYAQGSNNSFFSNQPSDPEGISRITVEDLVLTDFYSNPLNLSGVNRVTVRGVDVDDAGEGLQFVRCTNVVWENCEYSNTSNVAVGDSFEVSTCNKLFIRNLRSLNTGSGQCLDLFGSTNVRVSECALQSNNSTVGMGVSTLNGQNCEAIRIYDTIFSGSSTFPINAAAGGGDVEYHNCEVRNCFGGYYGNELTDIATRNRVRMFNTTFDGMTGAPIIQALSPQVVELYNCILTGNGSFPAFYLANDGNRGWPDRVSMNGGKISNVSVLASAAAGTRPTLRLNNVDVDTIAVSGTPAVVLSNWSLRGVPQDDLEINAPLRELNGSDQYINLGNLIDPITQSFTMGLRVKTRRFIGTRWPLMAKGAELYMFARSDLAPGYITRNSLASALTERAITTAAHRHYEQIEYFYALTYNHSNKVISFYRYVPDAAVGSKVVALDAIASTHLAATTNADLTIGFNGTLYGSITPRDARLFGSILTASQMEDWYNDTLVDSDHSIIGRWECDETSGTTVTDSSGNGNHGTWEGFS